MDVIHTAREKVFDGSCAVVWRAKFASSRTGPRRMPITSRVTKVLSQDPKHLACTTNHFAVFGCVLPVIRFTGFTIWTTQAVTFF